MGTTQDVELPLVRGIESTSEEFRRDLVAMCQRLDVDPAFMVAVMSFETGGTFSPSVKNKYSGATGLIQFMPDTAPLLGTTTAELAQMSAVEQLVYVEEYFRRAAGNKKLVLLSDVYITVFSPAFIGRPDSTVMYMAGSKQYAQNKGLDINGDGTITKGEAAARVQSVLDAGLAEGRIRVSMAEPVPPELEPIAEARPTVWPWFLGGTTFGYLASWLFGRKKVP
jgi:hypothetical protein